MYCCKCRFYVVCLVSAVCVFCLGVVVCFVFLRRDEFHDCAVCCLRAWCCLCWLRGCCCLFLLVLLVCLLHCLFV